MTPTPPADRPASGGRTTRAGGTRPRRAAALDGPLLGAVALGGALGAGARYALALALPAAPGAFPWATLWTNVAGCALMGVLMTVLDGARRPHRLLRPLVGTGLLGGFTTFSAYALETRALLERGEAPTAFAYLAGTPAAALLAVAAAARAARALTARAPGERA
ncbi:CrcB family protein [Streptomyces somaliensis]|uniref:fluoride efflux transporter FluC n=1 Tax=Streptomyces somaliensis TaxID=78355 RepID=UPI0020CEE020|nr:CrcB family protein [Streptomyces somaliensis]MCP9945383.1 CrcB family protein [Streptomyces somaliensis]MCP9961412.1 CrcB family protein [Streptomyces somaliensis]MCP9974219.1 CrcB family protein [Streptomyces somaliensis]